MKIGAIRALIKSAGVCLITTSARGTQWIGTEEALFLVEQGLNLTESSVCGLLDFSEQEQKKIRFIEESMEDCDLWPRQDIPQNAMTQDMITIKIGEEIVPLEFDGRIYFIEARKIKCAVGTAEYREYDLGYNENGEPLILIFDGMVQAGIVKPLNVMQNAAVLRVLGRIAEKRPGGAEAAPEKEEAAEQLSLS